MTKRLCACVALLASSAVAAAGEPAVAFTRKPAVKAEGAGVRIEFAVNRATDVAVSIVDAQGAIVRHLAAGVLGDNAPAPLQKGLAQSLLWDGTDDSGFRVSGLGSRDDRPNPKPETRNPMSVRVALGLTPAFDRMLGDNPQAVERPRSLAVGPDGTLYVFHVRGNLHPSDSTGLCSAFSRDGKYLRTVLPYPANLPEERLKGLKRLEIAPGVRVPFIYQVETRSLVPGAGELPSCRAIATKDGRVAFVGIHEVTRYAQPGAAWLTVLDKDGGAPAPVLNAKLASRSADGANLALSPDEKTIYAAGLDENKKPTHAVYRLAFGDAKPVVFAGSPATPGKDDAHFNTPRAVATDKDGNVYVADRLNDRIVVLSPDGKFANSLAVDKPEMVEVHRGTGAIYVLHGARKEMLSKFDNLKRKEPTAQVRLPYFAKEDFSPVLALDSSAAPPVLWVCSHHGLPFARYALLRIEDRGSDFGDRVEVTRMGGPALAIGPALDLGLDRATERLYVGHKAFSLCLDGRTGKRLEFKPPPLAGSGVTAAVGRDGLIYTYWDYPAATLSRCDLTGKPVPWPARGTDRIPGMGSPRLRGRGLAVDLRGNIYVLQQKEDQAAGDAVDANQLALYGTDGVLKNARLVDSEIRSLNSIQVDDQGNLYLALGLRPGTDTLPPGLKGLVPDGKASPDSVMGVNYYPLMYGSIAKFGPAGGAIRTGAGGVEANYGFANRTSVKGAQWLFSGASPVPSWRTGGTPDVCLCESPRIGVDDFGRAFFPDAGRFRCGVLDTNGNLITWFGGYGNRDSAGPASAVPTPAIPFTWPHAVVIGDEAVYVADRLAGRVVRAKLAYAAEESIPLP